MDTQPTQPTESVQPTPSTEPVQPAVAEQPTTSIVQNSGKTLGIISFVVSLLGGGLISIVLAIIALIQSKKVGQKNGFAIAGIVISAISIILAAVLIVTISIGQIESNKISGANSSYSVGLASSNSNVTNVYIKQACDGLTCNDISATLYVSDVSTAAVAKTIDSSLEYLWKKAPKSPDTITLFIASSDQYTGKDEIPSVYVDITDSLNELGIKPTIVARMFGSVEMSNEDLTARYN